MQLKTLLMKRKNLDFFQEDNICLCISLSDILYFICESLRFLPLFSGCRVTHAVDTCIYKLTWAFVCMYMHRQIHGKYSFVLRPVRASCFRINTFHGTGAYRSFIVHFLPLFFSFRRDSLFLLSRLWFALLVFCIYFVSRMCI